MKKGKAIGCLFAFTALVASGITFSGNFSEKVLTADELPEDQLYFAPAGITSPYTYSSSPTSEPKYSGTVLYYNTNDSAQKTYSFAGKDTPFGRMNVASTWNSYRGESVKVAVIDTGCYYSHEEFTNTNFVSCKNIYSGVSGKSAINDTHGHGTTSAAMIAASINSAGSVGIAPNVDLVVLKCVDSENKFSNAAVLNALQYCIDNNVDVINMSIQGYDSEFTNTWTEDFGELSVTDTSKGIMSSTYCKAKLDACYEAGITVVAAAGNYNTNRESYPAANDHVIAVASTGLTEANKLNKAGYSNYGDWIDICAPGYVYTPTRTSTSSYSVTYGTSFSAPLVTGAIALYKSKYPYAKPDQIEKALKETATAVNWKGGAGAINVGAFLDYVPVEEITVDEEEITIALGDTYQLEPTVLPTGASQSVTYDNLHDEVCTVNSSGLITPVDIGESVIEIKSSDFNKVSKLVSVEVVSGVSSVYKTMTFTSSTMSKGVSGYSGVSFTTTCDGITTTVTNGNNNSLGWDLVKFGSKNSVTVGTLENTTSIDKKITKIDLTASVSETNKINSATLYVSSSSSFTSGTTTSITISMVNGLTSIPITSPITNGYYKIVFDLAQTSSNGIISLSKIEYYADSGSTPTPPETNYTVSFNANGGTGSMSSATTTGSTYTTPSCTFTYSGHTFSKWALGSTSGTQYSAGSQISNISSDITLYAIWSSSTIPANIDDDYGNYYQSIGSALEGTSLKTALNTLNNSKRNTSSTGYGLGYDVLKTYGRYTEVDWTGVANVSGKMFGFYNNALIANAWDDQATWNREHVWPNSLGGNKVEKDMHMVRPASVSINSQRGNKYYGSASSLYDPGGTGLNEYYRGVAARIIFYCAIADTSLSIIDANSGNSTQMGKLSDLLAWNLQYGPDTSKDAPLALRIEQNRNREIYTNSNLQGNRNPFIDHPEYACKIWGDTNDSTRSICGLTGKTLESLTMTGTPSKTTYEEGESFDPTGLTIKANYSDGTSPDVTSSVKWTPDPLTEGTTSVTGKFTYGSTTKQVTVNGLTVTEKTSGGGSSQDYTISFKSLTSDSGTEIDKDSVLDDDYVALNTLVGSCSSASKIYQGTYGLKLGSSGNSGSFTFNLNSNAQTSISGMDIDMKKYGSDTGTVNYSIGSKSGSFSPQSSGSTQSATFSPVINAQSFTISTSSKRAYVKSITLHIEESGGSTDPKVNSITIDSTLSLDVYNNKTYTLTPVIDADEGADTTVSWSSNNTSVASVDSSGKVTAVASGTATITATCGIKSATCTVTVTDSTPVAVTSVQLNKNNTTITVGESETLTATINPSNATNKNVTWSSNNTSVATVSNNGVVEAKAVGNATITVTTEDGNKTATCTVTVQAAPTITYQLEASNTTIPYMSGTNHSVSVTLTLYQYSNGVKGNSVSSSSANVDTSSLGSKQLSLEYNNNTYYVYVTVTNHGAVQQGSSTPGSTYTATIDSKKFSEDTKVATIGGMSFTLATNSTYFGYDGGDSSKGQQVGSGNNPASSLSLTTSVTGTVSQVVVKTCGANSVNATLSVTVGGTNFKYNNQNSVSITSTLTEYTFVGSGTGSIVISWNQTSSKALYFKQIRVVTAGSTTNVFEDIDQARAWATYFINETRTDETCLAQTDELKLAGLQSKWENLAYEYAEMVDGAKDVFCSSSDSTIVEARSHYLYIVSKFGAGNLGTDGAFVKDSNNNVLQAKVNNPLSILGNNSSTALIVVISLLSVSAIGLYFYVRKRKED